MAYSKTFLLLGLLFAVVLIMSPEVVARELAETAQTQESVDGYGHGYGKGHGHYGHGKGHGHYGHGKGHVHHGGHGHGKPGHGASEDEDGDTEETKN